MNVSIYVKYIFILHFINNKCITSNLKLQIHILEFIKFKGSLGFGYFILLIGKLYILTSEGILPTKFCV